MMLAPKQSWIRDKSKKLLYRQINDVIHERIHVFYPLNLIIDTSEFQRLRHVKQLGLCSFVFPSADHCRFTHSLGVYALASGFVKELAESQSDLNITSQDQLCVCIAALIHDLGHGPFSHFYEWFLQAADPNHHFCHEEFSKIIFRRMLTYNEELRKALDKYLDATDILFIEELINPPTPFIVNNKWQLKGRPIEKSFLYEIVSNKHNGLDVDKFDYFLRDSLLGNVPIAFSTTTVGRIRDTTKVLFDENLGFHRLMFAEKHMSEIRDAFEARVMLHDRIYQHKTCMAVELFMTKVWLAADKHVRIAGDDGKWYHLSNIYENAGAFLSVDDRFIYMLKNSSNDELRWSRELIEKFERRELPRFVYSIPLDDFEHRPVNAEEVKQGILNYCQPMDESKVMVKIRCIHRGMGMQKRPIDRVRVYNERDSPVRHTTEISKIWFKYNTFPTGGGAMANVYVPFETSEQSKNRLHEAAILFERNYSAQKENHDFNANISGNVSSRTANEGSPQKS